MKYKNFILRTLDLLLILGVLWLYQSVALTRADAVAARQKEIADAESWNASVRQAQAEQETAAESGYLRRSNFLCNQRSYRGTNRRRTCCAGCSYPGRFSLRCTCSQKIRDRKARHLPHKYWSHEHLR